jgi:hypothetical protein
MSLRRAIVVPLKIFAFMGLAIAVVLSGTSAVPPSSETAGKPPASETAGKPPAPGEIARGRVDAARKMYQLVASDYRSGWLRSSELVYRWSRRWLESERDLNSGKEDQLTALRAHAQRMREVARLAQARYRRQDTTIDEATSAEYYRLEAEMWVDRANQR